MARDSINLQYFTYDATDSIGVVVIEKKAITVANGIELKNAFAGKDNSIDILIENTAGADNTFTVKAGEKQNAQLGLSNVPIPAGRTVAIDLMRDMARYERADGSVYIDFGTGFTGNIYAIAKRAGLKPVVS